VGARVVVPKFRERARSVWGQKQQLCYFEVEECLIGWVGCRAVVTQTDKLDQTPQFLKFRPSALHRFTGSRVHGFTGFTSVLKATFRLFCITGFPPQSHARPSIWVYEHTNNDTHGDGPRRLGLHISQSASLSAPQQQ
jgi:hypothetical protein